MFNQFALKLETVSLGGVLTIDLLNVCSWRRLLEVFSSSWAEKQLWYRNKKNVKLPNL